MIMDIIFYICLLLPILRIKSDLFNLLIRFFNHQEDVCLVDLPVIRFEELQNHGHRSVDRMCFICSADYDKDDVICQLSRCGHAFHSDCVGNMLHGKQTSCPFCRSPVFSGIVGCSSF
ncbi:putative chromatin regulator PHD family [Helianthus anomalus]